MVLYGSCEACSETQWLYRFYFCSVEARLEFSTTYSWLVDWCDHHSPVRSETLWSSGKFPHQWARWFELSLRKEGHGWRDLSLSLLSVAQIPQDLVLVRAELYPPFVTQWTLLLCSQIRFIRTTETIYKTNDFSCGVLHLFLWRFCSPTFSFFLCVSVPAGSGWTLTLGVVCLHGCFWSGSSVLICNLLQINFKHLITAVIEM